MAKLKMLKARVQSAAHYVAKPLATSDRRITGRRLQDRRFRVWQRDPRCAMCRKLVEYPEGFELDHKVALMHGGEDTEDNTQVLCIDYEGHVGCHRRKTNADLSG